jgi:hypothetical protein
MRSEYCDKEKTGGKQIGSVKLAIPSQRWGGYLARTIHLNGDEAGKVSFMRFLAMEANCQNCFAGRLL